jgi:predicted AAA+ superfamily ATPase
MAMTNAERVGKALELLNQGLRPFVERELRAVHGEKWLEVAQASQPKDWGAARALQQQMHWDTQVLLSILWDQWNAVFGKTLGRAERTLVSELRDTRNHWAHQRPFSTDDAYRAVDSVQRLLAAVAADGAEEVARVKKELLRTSFDEAARTERRRTAAAPTEGEPLAGLKPWREIVAPHPDVASGRYQQAEFAADLWQVYQNEGSDEYRDPEEFFRRTFLTEGLRKLLNDAILRLSGKGGEPVVNLQTNFGGGKTHALLALYHLSSGASARKLLGVDALLQESGVTDLPGKVRRAVLVGQQISPGRPHRKPDGTEVLTLWGELAWQLGGKEGYGLVAEDDRRATNPGAALRTLFNKYAPCLVLIDEWIRYAAQLHEAPDLPGGTFDTQFTFAQALSEAARASDRTLLVISIPASEIEFGGERGRRALDQLKNTIGRVESAWRAASPDESFEIVRRRLFEPITEPERFAQRDAVVRAFAELYRREAQDFPTPCREATYGRRIEACYPIHPDLFDRLHNEWSTLERFQRTRGVLRLMASVIHTLWERQDGSLLMLPGTVPMDAPAVQSELTRYLDDNWVPVIERDIDGPNSLPLELDRENRHLGRYSACRRVARAIYLGSAPTFRSANRGIEDKLVRLGCAQPGETLATFGDALRRLADRAVHLYVDRNRYWFDTHQNITRTAQDRAGQYSIEDVHAEIVRRLRDDARQRGDFGKVHVCPPSHADIPDEREARLVVVPPDYPHWANATDSPARIWAGEALEHRGDADRHYKNATVFLAADRTRLGELEQAARQYLAWKSIEDEREALNLDAFQQNQTRTQKQQADEAAKQRIAETFQWLLCPSQTKDAAGIEWQPVRLQGREALAPRASAKLKHEELLLTACAGVRLRLELDRIPLWRGDSVSLKQLAEDFARYPYLPRLRDGHVLEEAVADGVRLLTWQNDTFAYASGVDSTSGRYLGLEAGRLVRASLDAGGLLVKGDVAAQQLEREAAATSAGSSGTSTTGGAAAPGETAGAGGGTTVLPKVLRRFHGTVDLDALRAGRDAGKVAEEVLQHLAGQVGANVRVTLEIDATLPEGAREGTVRTVTENCRTLKFKNFGFEEA